MTPITDIGPRQSQPNVTFPDRVTTGGGEWASGNLRGDGDDNNFLAGEFGKTERPNRLKPLSGDNCVLLGFMPANVLFPA